MATKKFLELKEASDDDLQGFLADAEARYQKMRFDHTVSGLENPLKLREERRDIARIKTEIRRRELATDDTATVAASRDRIRARRRRNKKA